MKSVILSVLLQRRLAVRSGSSLLTLSLVAALWCSPAHAQGINSTNGLTVTTPNGYAVISKDDMALSSDAGLVRWGRQWDGQEWRFNPHWESLSQSWKNLTGSQSADTTSSTTSASTGGASSGSTGATAVLSSGSSGAGGSGGGCWVWVDEDWQPSFGTTLIGGLPQAEPVQPARLSPFNKVMGEDAQSYAPLQRVSVDYASLCAGAAVSMPPANDVEAIRRNNELYLGDNGRYAFSNRAVLEKREVRQIAAASPEALYASLGAGSITLNPQTNDKGYRWLDKSGDWIDYNTQGQVVAYGDRNNNTIWLARDTGGRLLGVVDPRGRVLYTLHYTGQLLTEVKDHPVAGLAGDLPARSVKYAYDERNRLVQVTDVRGHVTKYDYNVSNRLIKITDAEGRSESLAYTGDAVSRHTAADGAVTDFVFEYDDANKQFISKVTGPQTEAGRRVEDLTHNRAGKLVRQIVNGRTETEVRYDTGARAEIATNARGFNTRTVTNEFEQVVEVAYPDGTVFRQQYSPLNLRLLEKTNELDIKTRYEYDQRGNLIRQLDALDTPDLMVTELSRNAKGQIVQMIRKGRVEANGVVTPDAVWAYEYDAFGKVAKTTDPEGAVRLYEHSRLGELIRFTDPNGHAISYEINAAGQVIAERNHLGHRRVHAHDKVGNFVQTTDARGKVSSLTYDGLNRNTGITNPVGGLLKTQYNGHGLPVLETDEDGLQSFAVYDNFQRLTRQVDGKGNITDHDYDVTDGSNQKLLGSLGLPVNSRYPTYTEQRRFDARERQTTRTQLNPTPLGEEGLLSSSRYDKAGRVIESTNAEGKTSYFSYDAHGRTTLFKDSMGQGVALMWDARGNLLQVQDAKGQVTRFAYDRSNRVIRETLPLGQFTQFEYDAADNLVRIVDPSGHATRFVLDAADRPLRTEVTPKGAVAPSIVYTFTHDEENNLTSWSDGVRTGRYTHDDAGRLIAYAVDHGNGVTLGHSYGFSAAGRMSSLTYPDGTRIGFKYEAHGEPSGIEIPSEGLITVTDWKWVAPSRISLPGGTSREMTHDGLLKLLGAKVKSPGQQTLFELNNRYGVREELKQKALTDVAPGGASSTVTHSYAYDGELRVTQAIQDTGGLFGSSTETFAYDAAGNRVAHSQAGGVLSYDANNRLLQRGSGASAVTYTYLPSGELSSKQVGSSGAPADTTRYVYDPLGRLAEVQDGAGVVVARYAYDPFDNRIEKTVFRAEDGALLATPRRTLYHHGDEGLLAEADGSGQVSTLYGWKPDGNWGTDPLFIRTAIQPESGGASTVGYAYFHNDHLGTPMRATDKSGRVVWRVALSALGQGSLPSGNAITNNLRFAGQYFDQETGLHQNTRRYYDPEVGRYITSDPIGIAGGWNLYNYADGDPVNRLDPTGEWVWVVIRVAMTVYDTYTTYKEIKENGLCMDWTRLIPIPIKVPKIKWLTKRTKRCSNPCECMSAGGGNSFTAQTPVHVLDEQGKPALKPIAQLKAGDRVLANSEWRDAEHRLSYEPVTELLVTAPSPRTLVKLRLANGQEIEATDGHPFRTTEGWRDAILLKPGARLLMKGSPLAPKQTLREVELVDVKHVVDTVFTYNLEVANAHTFFVGEEGALVHNGRGATGKARDAIWDACGGKCSYCGCDLQRGAGAPNSFECDHYYPVAGGGDPGVGNQVGSCRSCNRRWGKNWPGNGRKPTLPGR
jgi:RHS repeat-associated protein